MKTTFHKTLTALALFTLITGLSNAQTQNQPAATKTQPAASVQAGIPSTPVCMGIPNLSPDQEKQISALKLKHQKEMLMLKNQLAEKRARLRTLSTEDKPDMTAINKVIDEISALQGEMMKKREAHRQDIRKLLTEEQRLVFDTHGYGKHHGMKGSGNCQNAGYGYGHGPHHGRGYGQGCHQGTPNESCCSKGPKGGPQGKCCKP